MFTTFVKADSSPLLLESATNRESLAHSTKRDSKGSVKIETSAKYLRYFDSAELLVDRFAVLSGEKVAVNLSDTAVLTPYRLSVIYRSEENN